MKRKPPKSYLGLVALLVGSLALVFLGYEFVERTWLAGTDMRLLHTLHILRGVGSTLIGAGLVFWFLGRSGESISSTRIGVFSREGIPDQLDWFIKLRWLAICGVGAAIYLSQHTLKLLPREVTLWLWLGVGALVVLNLLCLLVRRRAGCVRSCLLWQMGADMVVLTYLLHFSGGVENPLFVLYAFHVILGGILLSRHDAFWVAGGAAGLFLFLAFLEYSEAWEHYTLLTFPHEVVGEHAAHQFPFILGLCFAFLALLAGTAYFTTAIMDRLRENQRHLLRAERMSALGQLVAYIAHEINNPIGIISTQMKMILEESEAGALSDLVKEGVEIADRQAERAGRVVQSLLSFAKERPRTSESVRLEQALSEAVFIAEGRIRKAGIDLRLNGCGGASVVRCCYYDAVHIFLNLIHNAVDAMPQGGTLALNIRAAGDWIETVVRDTGSGIPAENLEKIFDPFFTSKADGCGNGLGLPISLALVKAAKGELRVASEAGKGSAFTVRYPRARR